MNLQLSYKWLCVVLLCISFNQACSKPIEEVSFIEEDSIVDYQYSNFEFEILELINRHRLIHNLSILKINDHVSKEALEHTQTMYEIQEPSHDGFIERHQKLVHKLHVSAVAENVAYGYQTPEAVLEAWLKSESHRHNIENSTLTGFGISAIKDEKGRYYITNLFIRE